MNKDEWWKRIIECLSRIASSDYQSRTWFGVGESMSSFDEIYAELIEDLEFESFIEKFSMEFSEQQINHAKEFISDMKKYADTVPESPSPHFIFNDPNWEFIREEAKGLLQELT